MTKMNDSSEDLPRPNSVIYNFHNQDEVAKNKTLNRWKKINKYIVIPLYRVKLMPLLGFGKIFLLLKTKGWKTGNIRRTPLEYRRYEDEIVIFAARGENSTWVKNIRANPNDVEATIGFHSFNPRIEFVSEKSKKLMIIKEYIENNSRTAKILFGWDPKNDDLETSNFEKLANLLSIVLLHEN